MHLRGQLKFLLKSGTLLLLELKFQIHPIPQSQSQLEFVVAFLQSSLTKPTRFPYEHPYFDETIIPSRKAKPWDIVTQFVFGPHHLTQYYQSHEGQGLGQLGLDILKVAQHQEQYFSHSQLLLLEFDHLIHQLNRTVPSKQSPKFHHQGPPGEHPGQQWLVGDSEKEGEGFHDINCQGSNYRFATPQFSENLLNNGVMVAKPQLGEHDCDFEENPQQYFQEPTQLVHGGHPFGN
mmetsp:Transcript_37486/g.51824  ORF Transcript_37486/g.51824 Transcript_37486/m.51824 type:complete len:234 (+) Transcript_37486:449-1150(+)